jgi:hypothetical protein
MVFAITPELCTVSLFSVKKKNYVPSSAPEIAGVSADETAKGLAQPISETT